MKKHIRYKYISNKIGYQKEENMSALYDDTMNWMSYAP